MLAVWANIAVREQALAMVVILGELDSQRTERHAHKLAKDNVDGVPNGEPGSNAHTHVQTHAASHQSAIHAHGAKYTVVRPNLPCAVADVVNMKQARCVQGDNRYQRA